MSEVRVSAETRVVQTYSLVKSADLRIMRGSLRSLKLAIGRLNIRRGAEGRGQSGNVDGPTGRVSAVEGSLRTLEYFNVHHVEEIEVVTVLGGHVNAINVHGNVGVGSRSGYRGADPTDGRLHIGARVPHLQARRKLIKLAGGANRCIVQCLSGDGGD
jgi:hypothetical protein